MALPPSVVGLFTLTTIFACGSGADTTWLDIEPASPPDQPSFEEDIIDVAEPVEGPRANDSEGEAEAEYEEEPWVRVLEDGVLRSEAALSASMADARAICFGELHPNAEHHLAQGRARAELARRAAADGRVLGVGFEMFQRPFQAALDAFVAGQIDEDELLLDTEYEARWGWAFELYRPLLSTARDHGLPVLALNAPTELTRKIARMGLDSLDAEEREQLPELDLENAAHACYFANLGRSGACPPVAPPSDTYTAQVVWDETMAETASAWLSAAGADAQLIIFAGMGHCQESAIPERITRRTGIDVLNIMPLENAELQLLGAAPNMFDMIVLLGF
jgi:uncharacterized iron-regulated protein